MHRHQESDRSWALSLKYFLLRCKTRQHRNPSCKTIGQFSRRSRKSQVLQSLLRFGPLSSIKVHPRISLYLERGRFFSFWRQVQKTGSPDSRSVMPARSLASRSKSPNWLALVLATNRIITFSTSRFSCLGLRPVRSQQPGFAEHQCSAAQLHHRTLRSRESY